MTQSSDDIGQAFRRIRFTEAPKAGLDRIAKLKRDCQAIADAAEVLHRHGIIDKTTLDGNLLDRCEAMAALEKRRSEIKDDAERRIAAAFPDFRGETVDDSDGADFFITAGRDNIIFAEREEGEAAHFRIDDEPWARVGCYDVGTAGSDFCIGEGDDEHSFPLSDVVAVGIPMEPRVELDVILKDMTRIRVVAGDPE